MNVAFVANSNILRYDKMTNASTGAFVDDATVTATIKDSAGTEVTGETFPVTLAYVALSDGRYEKVLAHGIDITAGQDYTAEITIVAAGGGRGFLAFPFRAEKRTEI